MAGGDPKSAGLHGKDIRQYVQGQSNDPPHHVLFWHTGGYNTPSGAMRDGDYKLLFNGRKTELFNLKDDLSESNNLAATDPERVKTMTDAWKKWAKAAKPELWKKSKRAIQYADYDWLKGSPHYREK